jgi:hypothetical protein
MARLEATAGPHGRFLPETNVDVVVGKQKRLTVNALVDSGADRTIVPKTVGEALGIDYDKLPLAKGPDGKPMTGQGAGGQFEIRECRGKVRWRNWNFADRFWVGPEESVPWVLLGRDDFFTKFNVRFEWSHNPPVFEIERV